MEKIKNPGKLNKLKIFKIVLDIAMSVLLILMYNSKVISLEFHELGGLGVCFLFLIHKVINWRWIVSVSKKIFSKNLAFKLRFGYIINFLLLISVLLVMLSGILISKVLFNGIWGHGGIWRLLHYASAAALLVLIGIHLGLHWNFVMGIFKRLIKIPSSAAKPVCILLTLIIVSYGAYSTYSSSFREWISAPFTAGVSAEGQPPSGNQRNRGTGSTQEGSPSGSLPTENNPSTEFKGHERESSSTGGRNGRRDNEQKYGQKNGAGPGRNTREDSSIINVFLTYASIIGLFAAITYYTERFLRRKQNNLRLQEKNIPETPL